MRTATKIIAALEERGHKDLAQATFEAVADGGWKDVPGKDGESYKFVEKDGHTIKLLRYKNGYISAWRAKKDEKDPKAMVFPISTPGRTKDEGKIVKDALVFLKKTQSK